MQWKSQSVLNIHVHARSLNVNCILASCCWGIPVAANKAESGSSVLILIGFSVEFRLSEGFLLYFNVGSLHSAWESSLLIEIIRILSLKKPPATFLYAYLLNLSISTHSNGE